jgi:lipoate-protein ligase A
MAEDLLLLDYFPWARCIRFRNYGWTAHAVTFGYSQRFLEITHNLNPDVEEICRRPTGGGMVDHENDWTYSLVVPPINRLFSQNPSSLYKLTHEAMASALTKLGRRAELTRDTHPPIPNLESLGTKPIHVDSSPSNPRICFQKAEVHDIICPYTGRKIAGAALKKNRRGLLLQGSIDKSAALEVTDWMAFFSVFTENLANIFNASREAIGPPSYPKKQVEEIHLRFRSRGWNRKR